MDDVDFTKLIEADDERRKLIREIEVLKNKKNKVSKEISKIKSHGGEVDKDCFKQMKEVSNEISQLEEKTVTYKGKNTNFLRISS